MEHSLVATIVISRDFYSVARSRDIASLNIEIFNIRFLTSLRDTPIKTTLNIVPQYSKHSKSTGITTETGIRMNIESKVSIRTCNTLTYWASFQVMSMGSKQAGLMNQRKLKNRACMQKAKLNSDKQMDLPIHTKMANWYPKRK